MTAITEENGPEIELCWMVAPIAAIRDFLDRHGETDYYFKYDSDHRTALCIRGFRTAGWEDVLVWRRGGQVIVAQDREVPYIEGSAALRGLIPRSKNNGRIVSYWPADRQVIVDAAPIESKSATIQWMVRHPEHSLHMITRLDKSGYKRPMIQTSRGEEFPRWYWLVWTKDQGVLPPITTAKWKALKNSYVESGVAFRTMFEGAALGFERKNTGVN